ncbi:hypothetical protein CA51_41840 [Rosistilla oblonga]|uniref:hypothetical protein n=1 Tax=Rosistilla oblonga TaxID=2527990 RepID=UPI001188AB87|nr:hypothetical protein [Rosistilla oblonga]QDV14287.1 hypothetical protein CA51_41840 [Rosistilla oblonga]
MSSVLFATVIFTPLIVLNFYNAVPQLRSTNRDMSLFGWPFFGGLMHADFYNNEFGCIFCDNKPEYVYGIEEAQYIDLIVGLVAGSLSLHGLVNFVIPRFPRFDIVDLFGMTGSIALVCLWFVLDPPVYIGNAQRLFTPDQTVHLCQTDRPLWQNMLASVYIFLSSYALFCALIYPWRRQSVGGIK